ncbi:hypothetical protein J5J86_10900 [Aquabacter sp. L1I39]|uniref:hypothetical protein n=1 Tax=Aquabacter sp. L1I39 TaxID=2820278 RepID=UPI001ADB0277|nr:hypothetical protein [Aquabacter sp. L1I39]QTL05748.1 hypothetical protein J5J86_10900 [Aquabacter sp. L1I39]
MNACRMAAVVLGSALLAGCVTDGETKPPGAGMFASLGPTPAPETKGLVAAPGGLLGGAFGTGLDDGDRQRAMTAETTALETGGPGSPVGWRGDNGAHGTVIAGPAYSRPNYARCRDFTHTIYLQGKPQLSRGVACRTPEGNWVAVS